MQNEQHQMQSEQWQARLRAEQMIMSERKYATANGADLRPVLTEACEDYARLHLRKAIKNGGETRSYMPGVGLFLSRVGFEQQTEGEHPYGYANNNPVTNLDPTGNRPICCSVACYINHTGTNPICLNRNTAFWGRGCAATTSEAYELANDQADFALKRWNSKRRSNCQFKHCDNEGCEPDNGQRGRRKVGGEVPAPVRWFANCSNGQLFRLCLITATGSVLCFPELIPVAGGNREKIPELLGVDESE